MPPRERGYQETMRVAAVQLDAVLGDVAGNLERCERLAEEALAAGAELVVLPEFLSTGVAFREDLRTAGLPPDGAATELMRALARRHGATVGGSFLCLDADGEMRNAFMLVDESGVLGRHDKDLPTMWENALYVEGSDDGLLECYGDSVGVALCWELMRTQTARRLRGRVGLVVGGSAWWSLPEWFPAALHRLEGANARRATTVAEAFAPLVGAPVVHAAHCGKLSSPLPGLHPVTYRGHFEGGAVIADADGRVLARRDREEGPGIVVAEVELGRRPPRRDVPDRYWLHRRGAIPTLMWSYQRWLGRRWRRRHPAREAHLPEGATSDAVAARR